MEANNIMEVKNIFLLNKLDWQKKKEKITFSVVSDGASCLDWNNRLKENVSYGARKIIKSHGFKKTSDIKTDIVIIKGEIFPNNYSLVDVYVEAKKCSLREMEIETAYLTVEKITAEDMDNMGLQYIIVMHQPIPNGNIFRNEDCLFEIIRNCECCRLELMSDRPEFSRYTRSYGFAFAANSPV